MKVHGNLRCRNSSHRKCKLKIWIFNFVCEIGTIQKKRKSLLFQFYIPVSVVTICWGGKNYSTFLIQEPSKNGLRDFVAHRDSHVRFLVCWRWSWQNLMMTVKMCHCVLMKLSWGRVCRLNISCTIDIYCKTTFRIFIFISSANCVWQRYQKCSSFTNQARSSKKHS